MISRQEVEQQLKKLRFNYHGWGRSEARELPNIMLPDEKIYEVVNGIYEGGFALLVSTDIRVLLVDKKPLNYLTVEDLRFDMINEIDYSHRLVGARISISAGPKNLKFTSYNQPRLRKLITHVQHCMADNKKQQSKHEEGQNNHLEQINQQLQAYLIAQHQQQQQLQQQLETQAQQKVALPEPVKPSPELSDFLYAQSLLAQHQANQPQPKAVAPEPMATPQVPPQGASRQTETSNSQMADLYAEGMQEIFGQQQVSMPPSPPEPIQQKPSIQQSTRSHRLPSILPILPSLGGHNPLELNPINIAYSKLPMALRNRKFGRPSLHAHSRSEDVATAEPALTTQM